MWGIVNLIMNIRSCIKTSSSNPEILPYGRQAISDSDIAAVVDVLRSEYLTTGPKVCEFEMAVAEFCGVAHAIATANGTAALHLACLAVGVSSGDVGLTSPLTFLASANCIAYCGGRPDFVDIDLKSYCLNPEQLDEYITKNGVPKVVIPVDFAGVPADLPRIYEMAHKYGFKVIEDAAHAIGSRYEYKGVWYQCGSCAHSDLAIFSFHPVKTITSGEGGMVLTNDDALAKKVRMLANHGIERNASSFTFWDFEQRTGSIDNESFADDAEECAPWLYQQQTLGFNYRLSDIHCALGLSQLGRLDSIIKRRRQIHDYYQDTFTCYPRLECPSCPVSIDPAYHLYVLRVKQNDLQMRFQMVMKLRECGICAQIHYIPVYMQPWYRERFGYETGKCKIAEKVYNSCLSLPLFPSMRDMDVQRVATEVKSALDKL